MKIPYVNLKKQWSFERKKILNLIDKVALNNLWVGGEEVSKFEKNISSKKRFNKKKCNNRV